ncbi:hypothetical protein K493DRAFT_318904 [Basidiobolus meristosporus CBS 931.73]|uniref:Protein YOP1 n=1 Tax=Basidiobolus meristosporus CBS 931.73 TaxID=1314790 RepID=A0A1Y1XTY0_9FUNG|nr:hypothetical protein K493DRAFT_318904 [Basidiobolus meristosporus CBS 931.73]|eukprot:ORX89173.1 hypothetical protein K493DRAFT_318904 [Basidiobolus meristosporus CBS 931.73]
MYLLAKLLCLSLGLYRSYKAIKSRKKTLLTQWVSFWIVMVAYYVVEAVADLVVGWWLPLYSTFKLILVGYFLFTQPWGTEALYKQHIRPFLKYYKKDIENVKQNYTTYLVRMSKESIKLAMFLANLCLTVALYLKDLIYRKLVTFITWQRYRYNEKESSRHQDFRYPTFQTTPSKAIQRSPRSRVPRPKVESTDSS